MISDFLKSVTDTITGWTMTGIGTTVATTGIFIKEFAVVVIMLGVLLWMMRCTKVFRWGAAGYMLGLILEIIGILIRG